jgi:hypothetical protein
MSESEFLERSETFQLGDGLGLLTLQGDEFETGLYFEAAPIALLWNDNEGSIGQMLSHAGVLDIEGRLKQLRHVALGNLDARAPIATQIYPLLQLFANGPYVLRELHAGSSWDIIEQEVSSKVERFYPLDTFVMTQPIESLDLERIAQFRSEIQGGRLPIVFSTRAETTPASFVVDGHHKLIAYRECRVPPRFVEVVPTEAEPLLPAQEQAFFPDPRAYDALLKARG